MGPTLRASCDSCNQAKVKCTKQQPQCQRCKKHSIECVYGISLRAGKRASQQAPVPKKIESPPPLTTEWNMDLSTCPSPYSPTDMGVCPSMLEYDMTFPMEGYQGTFFSTDNTYHSMMDLTFSESDHHTSTTTSVSSSSSSNPSPEVSDSLLQISSNLSFPTQSPPLHIPKSPSCGCLETTIHTLNTIQQMSESSQTSFDVALVHNKEAVALCSSTLNCSCSTDSTIVLLVVSLLAKTLHIYQRPCGAWKAVEHRRLSHDSKAITARLILGAYNVDEGDEEILKREIVRMELRKVESVISKLRDHLSKTMIESEQKLHDSLVGFLSDRLRSVYDLGNK